MTISSLEKCTNTELLEVLNLSFSDYVIPFQLTMQQFESKCIGDNVQLHLSVGCFEEGKLIGFVLHGLGEVDGVKKVYNSGTGIIPAYRGRGLTGRMYDFIIPVLKSEQISTILLEVITSNDPAIKAYQRIGFVVNRTFNCYKGELIGEPNTSVIQELSNPDWELLRSFWDWQPSWQNSIPALEKLGALISVIAIIDSGNPVAYLAYNTVSKRFLQYAVLADYRGKGYGQALFQYVATKVGGTIVTINVDDRSEETKAFLEKLGLSVFIQQYEMEMSID